MPKRELDQMAADESDEYSPAGMEQLFALTEKREQTPLMVQEKRESERRYATLEQGRDLRLAQVNSEAMKAADKERLLGELSDDQREEVLFLVSEGHSHKWVADKLSVKISKVKTVVNRWKNGG